MTVEIGGTEGLNYDAVILGVPEVGAAGAGPLPGKIMGGEIDETGVIVLYDDAGNSARFPKAANQPVIAASDTISWTNNVEWITEATSITNTVPSTVSLTVSPESLGAGFGVEEAVMIFVADSRAGSPPDNIEILPITMMCAQDKVLAPVIRR
jgi:hypothetical protein